MTWHDISPWIGDILVLIGVVVMTIGVFGLHWMPNVYLKLHAVSKAVVLGVIAIAIASVASGQAEIIDRVLLISGLLVLTTPVSAHVIGRAAYLAEKQAPAAEQQRIVEPVALIEDC
jgi:multicomponent Na+:H+ antiporter subunit G